MTLIEHIEVGSGGSTEIEFASIPATYTDLKIVFSGRASTSANFAQFGLRFNDSTTNYSERSLIGNDGSASSSSATTNNQLQFNWVVAATSTSNTFANAEIYIPNYASSNAKSVSFDGVTENNATTGYVTSIVAKLWNDTTAISSIQIFPLVDSFVQYSSATLYGTTAGSDGTTTVS